MAASRKNVTHAEQVVAAAFVRAALSFHYEPKEFRIYHPNGRVNGFNPDFFLPDHLLYVEVGNRLHKKHKRRWMRAAYPQVKVLIIDNDWVDEIQSLHSDEVLGWLWEKWVEQEYSKACYIDRRQQAREEAREARQKACIGPSLRIA